MQETRDQDTGEPGGGKGRVEEARGNVYPATGPLPPGDAEVRTPATLARGQVDEEGRPVEGSSEITMTDEGAVLGGATPPSSSPPQK